MAIFYQKKTIKRILGFLCLVNSLVIIRLSYRHKWVSTKEAKNTFLQLPKPVLENLLKIYRNLTDNTIASKTKEQAGPRLTLIEKPKEFPLQSGCYPYFGKLKVQPVPENDCDKPYVTMNRAGCLGNKMCQYASLYILRHLFGIREGHPRVSCFR
ncbi:hypothetical protein E2C01_063726 [Portunus trituberculatus]|uniref:Uncharacterized protein n=1 Tax=Portunus trituberculatus TaxID=210409 RepID=A0A5B7HB93_PORTR|nr:hypothetical protein [Portunus trituberculatus]